MTKEEQPHNSPVKNPAVVLRPFLNYLFNREELQKIEEKRMPVSHSCVALKAGLRMLISPFSPSKARFLLPDAPRYRVTSGLRARC